MNSKSIIVLRCDFRIIFFQLSTTPIPDGFLDIETEKIEYNNTCELPVKLFADTLPVSYTHLTLPTKA